MKRFWLLFLFGAAVLSARAAAPLPTLPPVNDVLKKVVERAARENENDRAFAAQYGFVRSKETDYRNGGGQLKKREAKTKLFDPIAEAENDRRRAAAKRPVSQPVSGSKTNLDERSFDKKNFLANPALLERFDFKMVGRESRDGRATLVLDFAPKRTKLPERELKDKFINQAAGRVWVDAADYAVVRGDLFLSDRVDLFGGLVGTVKKFTYKFDRNRTTDGLWYVRDIRWHLEGREVILNRIIDCHEAKTEVQKVVEAKLALKQGEHPTPLTREQASNIKHPKF